MDVDAMPLPPRDPYWVEGEGTSVLVLFSKLANHCHTPNL